MISTEFVRPDQRPSRVVDEAFHGGCPHPIEHQSKRNQKKPNRSFCWCLHNSHRNRKEPNETEMSGGERARAPLGVKVWKSFQKWSTRWSAAGVDQQDERRPATAGLRLAGKPVAVVSSFII